MRKIFLFLLATICSVGMGMAQAVPTNDLFGTYQQQDAELYLTDDTDPQHIGVDFYVATCGQTVMLRAISTGETTFGGAAWETQLRVMKDGATGQVEVQTDITTNNKNHYTTNAANKVNFSAENVEMHFFVSGNYPTGIASGYRKTTNFVVNRHSVNNPTADVVAPVLDVENTTFVDNGDGTITVTFGTVTADDEFFYYVGDKDHNLGDIALDNTITITKPTVNDGITYTLRAYAVDFNGNKSEYKEYVFSKPFDTNLNLALNKPSEAGTQQGDGVRAPKANNGNEADFWTCYGTGTSDQWWWSVDLGENYDVNRVRILFNDHAGTFQILSSVNGTDWSVYASEAAGYPVDITYNVLASARYFKFVSTAANVGIKEFEVYGVGVHVEDTQAPILTAAVVDNGSITDNAATINVTATDNVAVASCRLVDNANNYDETFDFNGGIVALTNLAPSTTYTFTVTVSDLAGNTSAELVMTAFTTLANTHIPSIAAPVPTKAEANVLSLYSDTYESIKLNSTHSWGDLPVSDGNIQGNNYLLYEVTKLEMDNGIEFASQNISEYSYMHVDIWSEVDATITMTVADAACTPLALTAQQWTSADLTIPAGAPASISHIKLNTWSGDINVNIAVDNIYFWKEASHAVNVTSAGWASLCLPFDATIPAGVTAYYASTATNSTITLSPIAEKIPANQGVVIAAAQGEHIFVETTNAPALVGNLFEGTTAATAVNANENYVLNATASDPSAVVFSTFTGTSIPAFKAYLPMSKVPGAAPERINFVIEGSNPVATGIENAATVKATKALVDGKIVIVRGNQMFNLNGQLVK